MALLVGAAAIVVVAGCSSPPQVVEISPERGAANVRSSEVVRVKFDRPMDRGSVQARFHVAPAVPGTVRWLSDSELTFEHDPFTPLTRYQAVLDPGYHDAQGVTNGLRHSWTFKTEGPPAVATTSPGNGDRDVDPASYITLTFNREMDPASLRGAISLSPSAPFHVRQDATDHRRVILAPDSLLEPRATYSVAVNHEAIDIDGNHVTGASLVTFTTGDFRALRHWVSFIAEPWPGAQGGADGVWIVNESRIPRRLVGVPVTAFTWSADGSRLLLRSPSGSWSDRPLAGTAKALPIAGDWADFLASGLGYAFLDRGSLQVLKPDGSTVPVSTGVKAAAVAPGGGRLAYVVADPSGSGSEIDGYDPNLRARYRLQVEPGAIDGLAWSPDGLSLAYRVATSDPQRREIKVRSLKDGGVVTVAAGQVSVPAWQADRRHLFFTAVVASQDGPVEKAFRLGVGDAPPKQLTLAQGMPADRSTQVDALQPSADGHQLALVSRSGGPAAVLMMNADGSGLTPLTEYDAEGFPYSCRAVAWTPS